MDGLGTKTPHLAWKKETLASIFAKAAVAQTVLKMESKLNEIARIKI